MDFLSAFIDSVIEFEMCTSAVSSKIPQEVLYVIPPGYPEFLLKFLLGFIQRFLPGFLPGFFRELLPGFLQEFLLRVL